MRQRNNILFSRRKIAIKSDILLRNKGQKQCNNIFNKLKRKTTGKPGFSSSENIPQLVKKVNKTFIIIF